MTVRNGTYLGECLVDCNEEIAVTPGKVVYSLTGNVPGAQPPDIRVEVPLGGEDWAALAAVLDRDALALLPSTIGRPDAGDAGGEFLEVTNGDSQRVDFPFGARVEEIAPLLDALRALRARLAREHGRK